MWDVSTGKEVRSFRYPISGAKGAGKVLSICLNRNNATLIAGYPNEIILWDVSSGNKITSYESGASQLAMSEDNKLIFSTDAYTCKKWEVKSGKQVNGFPIEKGSMFCSDFSKDGKYILTYYFDKSIYLWDTDKGKTIHDFAQISKGGGISLVSPDGKYLVSCSADGIIWVWDFNQLKMVKVLQGNLGKVLCASFSPDGKYLVTGCSNIGIYSKNLVVWDFEQGKILFSDPVTSYAVNTVSFSPDSKSFITAGDDGKVKHWDIKSGQVSKPYDMRWFNPEFSDLEFSPDGKTFIAADNGIICLRDAETGAIVKELKVEGKSYDVLKSVVYSPDGSKILSSSWNSSARIWDVSTGKTLQTLQFDQNDIKWLGKKVGIQYYGPVAWSPDGKFIVSGLPNFEIAIWDSEKGTLIKKLSGHTEKIVSICFTPDSRFIVSGSSDATTRIWSVESDSWLTLISHENKKDWLVFNQDGYWDASKNGGSMLVMVQGVKYFNIEQFASRYNRPDILIKQIGVTDQFAEKLHQQYQKRLKKMDLTQNQVKGQLAVPVVKLLSSRQKDKYIELSFLITDSVCNLKTYNIYMNEVPLYGMTGKRINGNKITITETIELTNGNNKIEISSTNDAENESLRVSTMAQCEVMVKPDLYFLGFGVSKYKDKNLNLNFADKDVLDLASVFEGYKNKSFKNVYIKTFVNDQVTKDAINGAKDFVKAAKPDDIFVLFIAGHGFHDSDSNATYYYFTYETDLKNLKNTAANFNFVEDLLQGIPPRNKLFLMDACESGELDEDDQNQLSVSLSNTGILSRGFKTSITTLNAVNLNTGKRDPEKDRFIYNNLIRRSGAIVFSSSKGGELSYERSDIENGLFTEYIIKALTTKEADSDGNGIVSTRELNTYVSNQVAVNTNNLQHPVIDRDNYYVSFGFQAGVDPKVSGKENKVVLAKDQFLDNRDGQVYKLVVIGKQTWMAQNLNYDPGGQSYCYENNLNNCNQYGRLYTWEMASHVCPTGWHLPSAEEWAQLVDFTGGENVSPGKLSSTNDWNAEPGTDNFGFKALPAGVFNTANNGFFGLHFRTVFWSSTKLKDGTAMGCELALPYKLEVTDGLSVRCVKN